MKIYVASSWRNEHQPGVVKALRADGHDVYDFRNPSPGYDGFHWSAIDPEWKSWDCKSYENALDHPFARRGFFQDLEALTVADLCVLVLPSGRSASFEYGFFCANMQRFGIVYMPEKCEPELMYSGAEFADNLSDLRKKVNDYKTLYQNRFPTNPLPPYYAKGE